MAGVKALKKKGLAPRPNNMSYANAYGVHYNVTESVTESVTGTPISFA